MICDLVGLSTRPNTKNGGFVVFFVPVVVFVAIDVDLDVVAGVDVNVICFRLDGITSTV